YGWPGLGGSSSALSAASGAGPASRFAESDTRFLRIRGAAGAAFGMVERGNGIERMELFPGDARRVDRPVLIRLHVATGSALFDHRRSSGFGALFQFGQFLGVFRLNAQVIQADLAGTGGNGEGHARVLPHPLGIVIVLHARLTAEQGRIKGNGLVEVGNAEVYMQTFHFGSPLVQAVGECPCSSTGRDAIAGAVPVGKADSVIKIFG